jgi:hypothetical protein
MKAIRKATLALLGVTVLWGGTFIGMQQSLNAAAAALPNIPEDDVVAFRIAFISQPHNSRTSRMALLNIAIERR